MESIHMLKTAFLILVFDACWNMPCMSPAGVIGVVGDTTTASEVVSAPYDDLAGVGVDVISNSDCDFELLEVSGGLKSAPFFSSSSPLFEGIQDMVVDD